MTNDLVLTIHGPLPALALYLFMVWPGTLFIKSSMLAYLDLTQGFGPRIRVWVNRCLPYAVVVGLIWPFAITLGYIFIFWAILIRFITGAKQGLGPDL